MQAAARLVRLPPGWAGPRSRPAPEVLAVVALIALAWLVLLLELVPMSKAGGAMSPAGMSGAMDMSMGGGMSVMGGGGPIKEVSGGMPMWSLMALAMMLPAALPATAHVARNSLPQRRGQAVFEFLVAYLLPWLGIGALFLLALALLPDARAAVLLAAALGVATAWELSPGKRWALNRCHRTSPLPPSGWRASLGASRFGLLHGGACVASCWPLMLVMAAAPTARLAWCAGLGCVGLVEKLSFRPRRSAHRVGLLLGVGCVTAALAVPLIGA
jgi:predicted metal-binding membrane protein